MALRKTETADQNVEVNENVNEEVIEQKPEPQPEPKPAETKAVANKKAAPAPVAANKISFFKSNEIVESMIAEAAPRDYTTIVATGGTFKISGDKTDIGQSISFYVMGSKKKLSCSTGDNSEESKQFFAAAYEGDDAHDGRSIDEWVQDAKDNGYDKARKSEYLDLFVEMIDHSKTNAIDLRGEPIVVLQLSFMSTKRWKQFADGLRLKCSWGQEVPWGDGSPVIRATAKPATSKGNDYTEFEFKLEPADQK